jgi:hypothetical protein
MQMRKACVIFLSSARISDQSGGDQAMKTPIHLWIVGIITLLWNAGGAFDYLMTQLGNANYLAMLTPEQLNYITSAPTWFEAVWAIGVWFSVLGSILLLARSRLAAPAFGLSFLGLAASSVYSFGIASPNSVEISGTFALVFTGMIAVGLIAQWIYARAMTRRGVLR